MKWKIRLAAIVATIVGIVGFAVPASAAYPLQSRGIAGFGPTGANWASIDWWQSPTYQTPSPSADTYHISVAYLNVPKIDCTPGNQGVQMTVNYKDNNTGVWTWIGVMHLVQTCSPLDPTYIGLAGLPHNTFFHIFVAQYALSTNCVGSSNCTAHIAW